MNPAQIELIQLLRDDLSERQARHPSYSLRAFARQLGITPAEISLILNGKRRVTLRMATKLLEGLPVEPAVAQRIIGTFPAKLTRRKRGEERPDPTLRYIQLSTDEVRTVADWYYMAILSLAETTVFRSDAGWIARSLRISRPQAEAAIEALLRLGLLRETRVRGKRRWQATGKRFTTTNDVPDASLRKSHAQALDLARDALDRVPIELREFGATTIAADPDLLPQAKRRLRELRREIESILESGQKREVYRLCIQLIPLTHSSPSSEKKA